MFGAFRIKIYRKIQVVNNIHRLIQLLTAHSMQKNNLPYLFQSKISYITILGHCLTLPKPGRSSDMPGSGRSFMTCTGRNAI